MVRVVGVDHLTISVSDYKKSKVFYGKLFPFLGFEVLGEYATMIGWTNGKTRFWISKAKRGAKKTHKFGDVGFHHYAFELRNRKDVDDLENFAANELKAPIVDPAGEYYPDYYAVFFLDPDGLKLEGMKWGEMAKKRKRAKAK
ncbi:MAG TPA: VOC family protein [Magnetospirillaceae bacterium]|jgi:catechol 2,3-dioxygenase-like lactoylglutathione lyase family enzyme